MWEDEPATEPAAHDRPALGLVIAWCLTIAGVLTFAAIVALLGGLDGTKIADRVVLSATFTLYPSALVLAAAVAWSLTDPGRRDQEQPGTARTGAEALLALCAAAAAAAGVYATAVVLGVDLFGAHDFAEFDWDTRAALTAAYLAPAFIAAAALYVIACDRRSLARAVADDSDGTKVEVPSWRLAGPAVVCVLIAAAALAVRAFASAFPASPFENGPALGPEYAFGPGPSVGDRIGFASSVFTRLPIVFAALAVVVIATFAAGARHAGRDAFGDGIIAVAGFIGLLTVAAAICSVWWVIAVASTPGVPRFLGNGWWARAATIGVALASASLGVAAGYVQRRRPPTEAAEPSSRRARFDVRVVGSCLIFAALGYAIFEVITVVTGHGDAIVDLLIELGAYLVLTIGLALAAVLVASSRREPIEPRAVRGAIVTIAGMIASATLATAAYVIVRVPVGATDARSSLSTESDLSDKISYVAIAAASALLAAGVLHLIWSTRRPAPIDDPEVLDRV